MVALIFLSCATQLFLNSLSAFNGSPKRKITFVPVSEFCINCWVFERNFSLHKPRIGKSLPSPQFHMLSARDQFRTLARMICLCSSFQGMVEERRPLSKCWAWRGKKYSDFDLDLSTTWWASQKDYHSGNTTVNNFFLKKC